MTKHAHPHTGAGAHGSRLRVVAPAAGAAESTVPGSPADLICECGVFVGLRADGDYAPVPCPLHPTPETVAALADSYGRQVDELAGTVEHCMAQLRVVAGALGELHMVLDEIAHISRGGRGDA
jgi:hypothetical protein